MRTRYLLLSLAQDFQSLSDFAQHLAASVDIVYSLLYTVSLVKMAAFRSYWKNIIFLLLAPEIPWNVAFLECFYSFWVRVQGIVQHKSDFNTLVRL